MKLGVITSLWAYAEKLTISESLERIAALGLRYVDILGFIHGDPQELSTSERRHVRKRLEALGLIPGSLVLLPPGNLASPNENEVKACLDYVKAGIDLIAFLGGDQVLFNGGKRIIGVPHDQSWENAVAFMRIASDYAEAAGVTITLEAEPYVYFLVNDLDSTLRMIKDVDHPHFLTALDLGHMNLSRDAPQSPALLKPWLARIHLSENDGIQHANAILGTGTAPLDVYLQALHEMRADEACQTRGNELIAVMELGVLGDDIEDPDEYARRSMEHVTKIAPYITC